MITMFGITLISETVIIINERSPRFVEPAVSGRSVPPSRQTQPVGFLWPGVGSSLISIHAPNTGVVLSGILILIIKRSQVGWCSRNSGAVASRTVNASLYNMCVQASVRVYSQIYRKDDAPMYRRGNRVLIIISCINLIVVYPGTKAYYIWRNKQRAKV
ncbi:hypothetical protein B0H14DRAFT_2541285 [Mycena olivaceomarginata]|nr:hypothetical protein B0H14DRAFT_2541285 [Mycena olivaceomarginata]